MDMRLQQGFRLDFGSSAGSYSQPALVCPDGEAFGLCEPVLWNGRFWVAWQLAVELMQDSREAARLRQRLQGLPDVLAAAGLAEELAGRASG